MRRALAAIALALAACGDPPPLDIKYTLTSNSSQLCYSNLAAQTPARSCSDVAMLCPAVLSVRILSPTDPTAPYLSICEPVPPGHMDLCSIAAIDLPAPAEKIPSQTLEVQVAVYRDKDLDHDTATGDPVCPADLQFAPDGLPLASAPSPAVGGRAFYHPGDSSTVVALGCTNEIAIQELSCIGMNMVAVNTTVDDFDTQVSVPPSLADHLNVLVGEPQPQTVGTMTQYELTPNQARPLDRTVTGPIPGWSAAVDLKLVSSACLEVLEDVPQATPSVTCKALATPGPTQLDMTGVRLAKSTLDQILVAAHLTQFPPEGLVVGVVLDELGNPLPNVVVTTTSGNAYYLAANRQSLIAGTTTSNGIFVSTDAMWGTTFQVTNRGAAYGGLVEGKVSIVVLQLTASQP